MHPTLACLLTAGVLAGVAGAQAQSIRFDSKPYEPGLALSLEPAADRAARLGGGPPTAPGHLRPSSPVTRPTEATVPHVGGRTAASPVTVASGVTQEDAPAMGASAPSPEPRSASSATATNLANPANPATLVPPTPLFEVMARDTHVRGVLARWASEAQWTFSPVHWTFPRDLPVQGQARFGGDFKAAVRRLLDTSERTDMPVQPCFYANQVLRVIDANRLCAQPSGRDPESGPARLGRDTGERQP